MHVAPLATPVNIYVVLLLIMARFVWLIIEMCCHFGCHHVVQLPKLVLRHQLKLLGRILQFVWVDPTCVLSSLVIILTKIWLMLLVRQRRFLPL